MYYYGIIYKIAGNHIWRMVRNIKNKDNPRSFGYAIRTGLISAFAMRLYRQNKRKVFWDYNCFPLRTANIVSLYSKRSDNISARTGMLRIDGGTPSGYKGPNVSHFHLNGKKEHIFNINRWPWKK